MYFEIYPSGGTGILGSAMLEWRWRLKSANHEILASGEGYKDRRNCIHVINLLQQTTISTPVREVAA